MSTPVIWDNTSSSTQVQGKYTYTGTLTDYNKVVILTLNIIPPAQNHGNITNFGFVAKQGEWIYYMNQSNDGKLSKAKTDGSSVKKLSDDKPLYINVIDDWVYYSNTLDNLCVYKVRTDGTERTKLNSDDSEFLNVVDGWIYYQNNSDDSKLYKMRDRRN